MNRFQSTLVTALLVIAFVHAAVATALPGLYGTWLQHIDTARYEFMNGTGE